MNAEGFRTLIDYQFWARDKLLAAAEGLSDEELARPNGFTYQSILGIFAHLVRGESLMHTRIRGEAPAAGASPPAPETMADIKAAWAEVEKKARVYFEGLSDADLEGERVQVGRDGKELVWSLWQYIINLATHSGQHRSEAAEALTMVGHSPGDLDFSVYMRFLRDGR